LESHGLVANSITHASAEREIYLQARARRRAPERQDCAPPQII